ncbi:LysR family transcriptional regulator [Vibrio sp. TRT 21S02]|uniref:LysR family transcriptional regulator n=1 Tax=Vibrio sp. TRT 21S02 TaxID=3418507 RepID=UPI003CF09CB3
MKDLNALHVFISLMDTRSTQRAAQKLGRSQSYVSKTLAQLRDDLNDPLFVRSQTQLVPTSYAMAIESKLRGALEQVSLSLEPEKFDPMQVEKITLHIVEPFLIEMGKPLIRAIREQSNAIIELRQWHHGSEQMLLDEEVDVGVHILGDKPQTLYQKRLHTGSGHFNGNLSGEYVKYIVAGLNEHEDHFKKLDPSIEATICVDNYQLMNQLMDDCFTLRYEPHLNHDAKQTLNMDSALIVKASRRQSGKILWLSALLQEMVERHIIQ